MGALSRSSDSRMGIFTVAVAAAAATCLLFRAQDFPIASPTVSSNNPRIRTISTLSRHLRAPCTGTPPLQRRKYQRGRPVVVFAGGISEKLGDGLVDGYTVSTIKGEEETKEVVQMLANWYLEVVMDEDFATGRTKERQLLQKFKNSVAESTDEGILVAMLPKDDPKNPVLMARVRDWSVESIVLSPLVQAQKPAKSLLEALGEAAKREGVSLGLPGAEALVPFGLE
uniref:Uncharacterized protein n=1 Tax=Lotharella oceanica TaxID=641309 RepID=A0A7S2TMR2_9EUKA